MSGSERHSVAEVARLLGISERGVRDRIERGTLDAVKEGKAWRILLPPEADVVGTTATSGSSSGSAAVGDTVATPALVESAIQRTGQQYTADLRTMLAELREVYAGQLEAKDAALAAKDETMAELRRRAEVAEATAAQAEERASEPLPYTDYWVARALVEALEEQRATNINRAGSLTAASLREEAARLKAQAEVQVAPPPTGWKRLVKRIFGN